MHRNLQWEHLCNLPCIVDTGQIHGHQEYRQILVPGHLPLLTNIVHHGLSVHAQTAVILGTIKGKGTLQRSITQFHRRIDRKLHNSLARLPLFGRPVVPTLSPLSGKLFDRLISQIEGYCFGGLRGGYR